MPRVVNCPTCRAEVPWDATSPWRPFCSDRCRAIDLGDWAAGRYAIAGDPAAEWPEPNPDGTRAN